MEEVRLYVKGLHWKTSVKIFQEFVGKNTVDKAMPNGDENFTEFTIWHQAEKKLRNKFFIDLINRFKDSNGTAYVKKDSPEEVAKFKRQGITVDPSPEDIKKALSVEQMVNAVSNYIPFKKVETAMDILSGHNVSNFLSTEEYNKCLKVISKFRRDTERDINLIEARSELTKNDSTKNIKILKDQKLQNMVNYVNNAEK